MNIGAKIILNGEGREVHGLNYAQTTSLCSPGDLTASEMYRVDN